MFWGVGWSRTDKVSAKGSSGGGVKIGPLSAQHGIAEITDLYRKYHEPVPLESKAKQSGPNRRFFYRWLGELCSGMYINIIKY
jgi:hypothetical protein